MTFADTAGQFAGGGGGAETVGITNNWPNAFTASYDTDVAGFQRQPYDKDGDGVLECAPTIERCVHPFSPGELLTPHPPSNS